MNRSSSGSIPTSCRRRSRSSTTRERMLARAGSPPTRPATQRCASTSPLGRTGSGRSRAATAPAGRWPNACWLTATRGRRPGQARRPGHGCSTPGTAARPTPTTRTRSRSPRSAPRSSAYCARPELEAMRMLVDRRDELTRQRVQTVNRLHRLLAELTPGPGEEGHHRPAGQGDTRPSCDPRPGRQDPPTASRPTSSPTWSRSRRRSRALTKELNEMVAGQRHGADGPAGCRADRRRPGPGRGRRRHPVRRPEQVRVLDRHRTTRSILRRAGPAPAVPGREPADEPHDPHRRDHPDPPRHRGPGLLPTQARRRQDPDGSDALPQATDLRRPLPPTRCRRPTQRKRWHGPGRALRGVS